MLKAHPEFEEVAELKRLRFLRVSACVFGGNRNGSSIKTHLLRLACFRQPLMSIAGDDTGRLASNQPTAFEVDASTLPVGFIQLVI